jgi:predicted nucleic acid-binding protein
MYLIDTSVWIESLKKKNTIKCPVKTLRKLWKAS